VPAGTGARARQRHGRFDHPLVGDPAGRVEFREWSQLLGRDGFGVPYLRYLPASPSEVGANVASPLAQRLGEAPSFVPLEGYDTIRVVYEGLRLAGGDRERLGRALLRVKIPGTRGLLQFFRTPGVGVLQWTWPPVQVAAYTDASQGDQSAMRNPRALTDSGHTKAARPSRSEKLPYGRSGRVLEKFRCVCIE